MMNFIEIAKKRYSVRNYSSKKVEKEENSIFPAKTVNDLARMKFKEQLLKEIMVDLMVCEIEGWDKKEYIKEIRNLINSIDLSNKKQKQKSSTLDLFGSL